MHIFPYLGSYKAFDALIKGGADPALKAGKGTVRKMLNPSFDTPDTDRGILTILVVQILHVLLAKKKWRSDEKKILKKAIPLVGKESVNLPAGTILL